VTVAKSRIVVRAYGRTVGVDVPADCRDLVRERLPAPYREIDAEPEVVWGVIGWDQSWMVWRDEAPIGPNLLTAVAATEFILSDLELWVAEFARGRVFVHAGCVVVDGRAIVIPGRSMSGKSSLTAALVRAGAQYYSDEYAVLDSRGLVRPYARSLSIRPYEGGFARRVHVSEFGGAAGTGPRPVGLVLALQYDAAAGWCVEALTRGQGIVRLLDNTVSARSRPEAALTALDHATQDAGMLGGTRGDADEAVAHVLEALRAG
jgi:hypothetical protein